MGLRHRSSSRGRSSPITRKSSRNDRCPLRCDRLLCELLYGAACMSASHQCPALIGQYDGTPWRSHMNLHYRLSSVVILMVLRLSSHPAAGSIGDMNCDGAVNAADASAM